MYSTMVLPQYFFYMILQGKSMKLANYHGTCHENSDSTIVTCSKNIFIYFKITVVLPFDTIIAS